MDNMSEYDVALSFSLPCTFESLFDMPLSPSLLLPDPSPLPEILFQSGALASTEPKTPPSPTAHAPATKHVSIVTSRLIVFSTALQTLPADQLAKLYTCVRSIVTTAQQKVLDAGGVVEMDLEKLLHGELWDRVKDFLFE
jgi:hypothetical protein